MKYYLKNAKHLYIREYFKDESWDMIYEALKLLAKKEGFDDMFEEYDKKYYSMHMFNSQENKKQFIEDALKNIFEMFEVTDGGEFSSNPR